MSGPNKALRSESGMSPAWQALATRLRAGLEAVGVEVARCEPGDPDFCGADYAHHALSYGAALKAYGEETLGHIHHDDEKIAAAADALVDHWRQLFASQGENCDHCVKPAVPDPEGIVAEKAGADEPLPEDEIADLLERLAEIAPGAEEEPTPTVIRALRTEGAHGEKLIEHLRYCEAISDHVAGDRASRPSAVELAHTLHDKARRARIFEQ